MLTGEWLHARFRYSEYAWEEIGSHRRSDWNFQAGTIEVAYSDYSAMGFVRYIIRQFAGGLWGDMTAEERQMWLKEAAAVRREIETDADG